MYAIIGITGHVGGAAADILLNENLPVRAILRDPAKANAWQAKGAGVALAELHDTAALAQAFAGADGVFVMTPPLISKANPMAEHDQMLDALFDAIEKAQPKKVVYLSSIGAHLPTGTGAIKKLYDMEQSFKLLTVPTAGIRAGWFMENFAGSIAHARQSGQFSSFLNPLDLAVPMIATHDIGKLAAQLLQQNWAGHRIVELEGPCRYSAADVVDILANQTKSAVTPYVIPAADYQATYQSFGSSAAGAALMAEMHHGFNSGHITFEGGICEHVNGETLLEDALNNDING